MGGKRYTANLTDFKVEAKSNNTYADIDDVIKYSLPVVEFGDVELKGAGIPGVLKLPDIFNLNELVFSLTARSAGESLLATIGPGGAEFRITEAYSKTSGSTDDDMFDSYVYVVKGLAKGMPGGDREKGGVNELENTYAAHYYKQTLNGKVMYEIDIANNKIVINGVDYSARLQAALQ